MNDPIPITKDEVAIMKERHSERLQWAFLGVIVVILGSFLVPLVIWLSRLAAGG